MTREPEPARLGLFGGTFNPIHLGHLRAAEEVVEALGLERLLFLPAAAPPHKREQAGGELAPAAERLRWVRLAIADNPRFDVETAELERGGPSYSVETLRAVAPRVAPGRPWFVIGSDAFAEIDTWREPEAVLSLAHFAVVTRPPRLAHSLEGCLPASLRPRFVLEPDGRSGRHREAGTRLRLLRITALDVSASDVRARLREGRSVRYLLPEAVHDAVVKSGLYRDA